MKKGIIVLLFLGFSGFNVWSQDLLGFESIEGSDAYYFRNIESKALESANYLLKLPYGHHSSERTSELEFMMMWMSGTPDYIFYIDESIEILTHYNKTLLEVYMACLTKTCLENKSVSLDRNELKYRSFEIFLEYCLNPVNKVKTFRQLELLAKANENGRLREYLED